MNEGPHSGDALKRRIGEKRFCVRLPGNLRTVPDNLPHENYPFDGCDTRKPAGRKRSSGDGGFSSAARKTLTGTKRKNPPPGSSSVRVVQCRVNRRPMVTSKIDLIYFGEMQLSNLPLQAGRLLPNRPLVTFSCAMAARDPAVESGLCTQIIVYFALIHSRALSP